MKISTIMMVIVSLGVSVSSVLAHHSVYGMFDKDAPFEITGVVTETRWINPHIYIHLDVTDESGEITEWKLETFPPSFMRKGGITKEMLAGGGEPVTVTGIAAIKDTHIGWIHRITYADGHYYQLSNEKNDAGSSRPSVPEQ